MKVKDLISQEIDIDVYDDVCEELGIAFCGPLVLTERGKKKFSEVLEFEITMISDGPGGYPCVIVHVDRPDDSWKGLLRKAKEFFYSAAGYCDNDDYEAWFEEE